MIKIGNNLSEWSSYSCQPKTTEELRKIIEDRIKEQGNNCDLNDIDVSLINDMSYLFFDSKFNGDISNWDVSNVEDMSDMFISSRFNGDLSNWNVSNVEDMSGMFIGSKFSCNINKWKINDKCDTYAMFYNCPIKEEFKPKAIQK